MFNFKDLKEIKGLHKEEVEAWLDSREVEYEYEVEYEDDGNFYIGNYWSDDCITIEIEDDIVVRWYRADSWD